jgi:DNA-directed RNA polymerase specialized sigma subunit
MDCGAVRQVPVRFAHGRRSYTKAFERHVLELSRHMTIQDVARHLQVSWDVVCVKLRSMKSPLAGVTGT